MLDIKPDNILVDWTLDFNDKPKVTKVALGDLDLSLKLINERPLRAPYAIGNVMWRSPEGQSGKGIAKASDVYAFGLVVSIPCCSLVIHQRHWLTNLLSSASMALEEARC